MGILQGEVGDLGESGDLGEIGSIGMSRRLLGSTFLMQFMTDVRDGLPNTAHDRRLRGQCSFFPPLSSRDTCRCLLDMSTLLTIFQSLSQHPSLLSSLSLSTTIAFVQLGHKLKSAIRHCSKAKYGSSEAPPPLLPGTVCAFISGRLHLSIESVDILWEVFKEDLWALDPGAFDVYEDPAAFDGLNTEFGLCEYSLAVVLVAMIMMHTALC